MNYGFIYCLGNDAMPGVYKIGMTERAPSQRCAELSGATAAPLPFSLLFYGEVENPQQIERAIHEQFSLERISPSREFFRGRAETYLNALHEWCLSVATTNDGAYYLSIETFLDKITAASDESERVSILAERAAIDGIRMWTEDGKVRFNVPTQDMVPRWLLASAAVCKDILLKHLPTEYQARQKPALVLEHQEDW
ncbi:GIY-YIG nuclease family protein [Pseudomonas sp. YH-1]|uniref:GIY-YIG nuclease family protein n=1 Tax=Pseudomonas sp. YH-1 TaxID=3384787 RepID=UPI003F823B50